MGDRDGKASGDHPKFFGSSGIFGERDGRAASNLCSSIMPFSSWNALNHAEQNDPPASASHLKKGFDSAELM
jgi:hypothetical protein